MGSGASSNRFVWGMLTPSNMGSGAAVWFMVSQGHAYAGVAFKSLGKALTLQGEVCGEIAARLRLVVANQAHCLCKVLLCEETAVLRIRKGPYLEMLLARFLEPEWPRNLRFPTCPETAESAGRS